MIIMILISIPLIDADTWFSHLSVYDKSMNSLVFFAENYPSDYSTQSDIFISQSQKYLHPLLYFKVDTQSTQDIFPNNYPDYSYLASIH